QGIVHSPYRPLPEKTAEPHEHGGKTPEKKERPPYRSHTSFVKVLRLDHDFLGLRVVEHRCAGDDQQRGKNEKKPPARFAPDFTNWHGLPSPSPETVL